MSFTNKTPNYNLPQWLGTDKPSWLVDVNGAFSNIDTAIKAATDSGSGADATARAALETAHGAQETANGALEQADNANTKSDAANVTAGNAQTAAGAALNKVNELDGITTWKYIIIPEENVNILGYTKETDFETRRNVLFYNEKLKLMQISTSLKVKSMESVTLTVSNGTNPIFPSQTDYPLYELPFSCSGAITITGASMFSSTFYAPFTSGGTPVQYYSNSNRTLTIKNYNGKAWMHVTFDTPTEAKMPNGVYMLQSSPIWINTNALGVITMDGWQEIN